MLDNQKLSYEAFKSGLHHGVYIFSSDACQLCQDYKKEIEHINNHYLYFVELTTDNDRDEVRTLVDRMAFPMTVGFIDGDIMFTRLGQLFGDDWLFVTDFLKRFGDSPLTAEQIQEKEEVIEKKCEITFYVFPDDTPKNERIKTLTSGFHKHECAIDVDELCPSLDCDSKLIMLKSFFSKHKFIIFNPRGNFGPEKTRMITDFYEKLNQSMIVRELDG